jgi:hypothetical protein
MPTRLAQQCGADKRHGQSGPREDREGRNEIHQLPLPNIFESSSGLSMI